MVSPRGDSWGFGNGGYNGNAAALLQQPATATGSYQFMGAAPINGAGYWNPGTAPATQSPAVFNPGVPGVDSRVRSPQYVSDEARYYAGAFGNTIGGLTPGFNPYMAGNYGDILNQQGMASQARMLQQYGGQYGDAYNQMYGNQVGSQIAAQQQANAATPGFGAWDASRQANLKQAQANAQNPIPDYMLNYLQKSNAASRSAISGAFGAPTPSNQFGQMEMIRSLAPQLQNIYNQNMQTWHGALNGYQPTVGMANIGTNQSAAMLGNAFLPQNNFGAGVSGYGSQYGAQAGAMGNLGQQLTQKFMPSPIRSFSY